MERNTQRTGEWLAILLIFREEAMSLNFEHSVSNTVLSTSVLSHEVLSSEQSHQKALEVLFYR